MEKTEQYNSFIYKNIQFIIRAGYIYNKINTLNNKSYSNSSTSPLYEESKEDISNSLSPGYNSYNPHECVVSNILINRHCGQKYYHIRRIKRKN